jgi:hypothetical protein
MSQAHTEYVLETHGFETGLRFHLGSRCFPPALSMYGPCKRAIKAVNLGKPEQNIRLETGQSYKGRKLAPASAIVENFRLDAFVREIDAE